MDSFLCLFRIVRYEITLQEISNLLSCLNGFALRLIVFFSLSLGPSLSLSRSLSLSFSLFPSFLSLSLSRFNGTIVVCDVFFLIVCIWGFVLCPNGRKDRRWMGRKGRAFLNGEAGSLKLKRQSNQRIRNRKQLLPLKRFRIR